MAANSKHNGDIAIWVKKVIESCETPQQINNARRLMLLFSDKLDRENVDFLIKRDHIKSLQNEIDLKYCERLENLKKQKSDESNVS